MLTLEEQERRAYIAGNAELAAALAIAIDGESEEVEELEHEVRQLKQQVVDLEAELEDARA